MTIDKVAVLMLEQTDSISRIPREKFDVIQNSFIQVEMMAHTFKPSQKTETGKFL